MHFRFLSAKWNAATRYSARPFTTKTGARVHFFCLNSPRNRGWYQAHVFTLLVVEMVRGILLRHLIVQISPASCPTHGSSAKQPSCEVMETVLHYDIAGLRTSRTSL